MNTPTTNEETENEEAEEPEEKEKKMDDEQAPLSDNHPTWPAPPPAPTSSNPPPEPVDSPALRAPALPTGLVDTQLDEDESLE